MLKSEVAGFSLIELMITIAILGIVLATSASGYRVWIQNTRIRSAAESIENGLQIARAEAVKRNASVQFNFRTRSSWTVCLRPTLPGNCPDPDNSTTIQSRPEAEGSSADITIAPTPAGRTRVSFNNFGQVDAANSPFSSVDIDSTTLSSSDKRNLRVTINLGGSTRMCDPHFVYPADPKGCP